MDHWEADAIRPTEPRPTRQPEEDLRLARQAVERELRDDLGEGSGYPPLTAEDFAVVERSTDSIHFAYFEGDEAKIIMDAQALGPDWYVADGDACARAAVERCTDCPGRDFDDD